MSIFGKIFSTIFGGAAQAAPAPSAGAAPASAGEPAPAPASGGAAPAANVDVTAMMNKLADEHDEDLDWKKSIVDFMKLLGMDSSLTARRELAKELGYSGDTKDTATMNIWLHKQVMAKLAANGGKLPKELLD